MPEHQQIQQSKKPDTTFQKQATPVSQTPASNPFSIIQRAKINPKSLTHADIMQLQRTIGNRAVGMLLSGIGSSSTAQQATVQRQEIPEEEEPLQGKMIGTIQRQEIPEGEEPLQGKMIGTIQRQEIPEEEEPLQGKMIGTVQRQEIPEEEEPSQSKMAETVQRQEIPEEEEPPQGKMIGTIQQQEIPEEEEPLQGKMADTIQRQEIPEEEEPLQGKMIETVQRQEIPEEEEPLQGKMIKTIQHQEIPEEGKPLQTKKENNTGIPDNLKAGVESLSEIDMSDVRVHYNSDKPAEVGALAYTQGMDIHVAPGQERHLPHEAWHVVQQKQERVKPTVQMKIGMSINDDLGLEREAEIMGGRALSMMSRTQVEPAGCEHSLLAASQGQNLQLKSAGGTLLGVIQRVGDKMAFKAEDMSSKAEEIQQLSTAIKNIYDKHKSDKKAARKKLDQDFAAKTADLELRQNYLIKAIEMAFYKYQGPYMVHNFSQEKFNAQIDKRDSVLVQNILPDWKKLILLEQAKRIAESIYPMVQTDLQERSDQSKKIDINALNSILHSYSTSYGRHAIADPIVQGYEKGYQASGMCYEGLRKAWIDEAKTKHYSLTAEIADDVAQLMVKKDDVVDAKSLHIATVYFNDKRFVPEPSLDVVLNAGTPKEEKRKIFKHLETGEQYVQDAQDIFVRRYVSRALNKYDNPDDKSKGVQINVDPRVKKDSTDTWAQIATKLPGMDPQRRDDEIRGHQRAKEAQDGSPFISFTTTGHPIFGSSAKLFESERGVAKIDLAQISKSKIFDTHSASAMKRIHDVRDPVPDMPYLEGDDVYERNSAARDAMRTRELVVSGDIPSKAIISVYEKGGPYLKRSGKFYKQ